MSVLIWFLWGLLGLLVVATALPFTKLSHGSVQGLAFPRVQFLWLSLGTAGVFYVLGPQGTHAFAIAILTVVALIQGFFIAKFTPFWSRQSMRADDRLTSQTDRHLSILAANVKMSNRQYDRLAHLIKDRAPDIVLAIEVDAPWLGALKNAYGDHYAHWVDVPQDNGYGICVMSHLPLSDVQVRARVTKDVPSVRTRVTLRCGTDIRLYVVHPEPPVIDHDTIGRNSEIALIGLEAAQDHLPTIVTGDLNDVAWSTTTRRFQRLSGLLDPRVGRGFYNTFSATMPWMRWPLDHLFHSPEFRLLRMTRERKIGSDHFPMWFSLALADSQTGNGNLDRADPNEVKETEAMIRKEQQRDREPIGGGWEKDNET